MLGGFWIIRGRERGVEVRGRHAAAEAALLKDATTASVFGIKKVILAKETRQSFQGRPWILGGWSLVGDEQGEDVNEWVSQRYFL